MFSFSNHSSFDGARDEAVEMSAERLMLFVNLAGAATTTGSRGSTTNSKTDSVSSEGYASDVDNVMNSGEETEIDEASRSDSSSLSGDGSFSASNTTKADDSSSADPDEPDDSSIENEIEFLQQKQSLLKRAIDAMRQEDTYEAFRARDVINGKTFERPTSHLWEEAREIVELLNSRDGASSSSSSSSSSNRDDENRNPAHAQVERPTKKARMIDVSSVQRLSASASTLLEGEVEVETPKASSSSSSFQVPFPTMPLSINGTWMGQALAKTVPSLSERCSPTPSTTCTNGWEMVNDPDLGRLAIPPTVQPYGYGIELKDALGLTQNAQ